MTSLAHSLPIIAVGLFAELMEAGCAVSPRSDNAIIIRSGDMMENTGYTTNMRVGSCMDDNPDPPASCM